MLTTSCACRTEKLVRRTIVRAGDVGLHERGAVCATKRMSVQDPRHNSICSVHLHRRTASVACSDPVRPATRSEALSLTALVPPNASYVRLRLHKHMFVTRRDAVRVLPHNCWQQIGSSRRSIIRHMLLVSILGVATVRRSLSATALLHGSYLPHTNAILPRISSDAAHARSMHDSCLPA